MRIFHGGIEIIKNPMIIDSQRLLDFGKGFYTTSNQEQAEKWAKIKKKRFGNNAQAIVSVFEIDDNLLKNENYNIQIYAKADEFWLDFIVSNRKGILFHTFDIVSGAVANDTLYSTLTLFETGILTKMETIKRLKAHKLFDQISFHTQKVLKEICFLESFNIEILNQQ